MPRRNPTERLWKPAANGNGKTTIQVIDRGDPADDRAGVPFGFSRALVGDSPQQTDGWDEHAEMVSGDPKC